MTTVLVSSQDVSGKLSSKKQKIKSQGTQIRDDSGNYLCHSKGMY